MRRYARKCDVCHKEAPSRYVVVLDAFVCRTCFCPPERPDARLVTDLDQGISFVHTTFTSEEGE